MLAWEIENMFVGVLFFSMLPLAAWPPAIFRQIKSLYVFKAYEELILLLRAVRSSSIGGSAAGDFFAKQSLRCNVFLYVCM